MSYFTAWIASLILIGSVWSQLPQQDGYPSPRFGFGFLEPLRKKYCTDYCKSADSVYITNLACAIKCPELYLPYLTTTTSLPTNVNITNSSSLMGPQSGPGAAPGGGASGGGASGGGASGAGASGAGAPGGGASGGGASGGGTSRGGTSGGGISGGGTSGGTS